MQKLAHFLAAEAFLYPTEDEAKVAEALRLVVPYKFVQEKIEGYHGATIVKLFFETKGQKEIREVLARLKQFKEQLLDRIDEGGNLYVRVDKQRAALGEIALDGRDTIRIKVKIASYPFRLQEIMKNAEALLS